MGPKGGPKISRFFSFSRPHFHLFFSLSGDLLVFFSHRVSSRVFLWMSSRGILDVFWSVGTNVLVFALELSCGSTRRPAREILGRPAEGGPAGGGGVRSKIGQAKAGGQSWPKPAQIGQVQGCGQSLPGCGQSRPGQSRPGHSGSWPK